MLDNEELTLTLDELQTNLIIFHKQPANNHNSIVPPPSFILTMVPVLQASIGNLQCSLKTQSNFQDYWSSAPLQPNANDALLCHNNHVDYDRSPRDKGNSGGRRMPKKRKVRFLIEEVGLTKDTACGDTIPVYVAEGLILERQKAKEETERLIAKASGNIQAQIKTHIDNAIANVIPSQVDASVRRYMSGHILHVHPAQSQTSSVPEQQYQLYLAMKDDPQLQQQDIAIWLALQMKFGRATVPQIACRTPAVRPRNQDEPHDDAHPEGENSAKRQNTSEYEAYVSGESLSGQDLQEELAPSTLGNQEQDDDFDFWTDSYASDDDEIPSKQVS
ncbi:hypothetical protein Tco_0506386 [Tanacetum coccineum]